MWLLFPKMRSLPEASCNPGIWESVEFGVPEILVPRSTRPVGRPSKNIGELIIVLFSTVNHEAV